MRANTQINDDESLWRVECTSDRRPVYVVAPNKEDVQVILGRVSTGTDFEFGEYDVIRSHYTDIEDAVRGDEPPFSVFEATPYTIEEHEKRVNQAGFKGVYQRAYRR